MGLSLPNNSVRLQALALLCALPMSAASIAADSVQSLRYGASLYHFYQRDYFGALTELTAGKKLGALGPHTDGAELLRGGMSLSYGMDRQAEAIFRQQLESPDTSVDTDRAWFYLGKMAWQRGEPARALAALQTMEPDYDGALRDEALYLRASAALAQGDSAAAGGALRVLNEESRWYRYLSYNLGATHAGGGDWKSATRHFAAATAFDPVNAEDAALRDKSLTASGYAYLYAAQHEYSAGAFRQVRLEGPYATRALLGYGWSAAERGEYLEALSPWLQLAERSLLDESARESLLAVPYAYQQLGRPGIALDRYRVASARYTTELDNLQQAIESFRSEPLAPLLGITEEENADWFFATDILPDSAHSPYLQHLVTRHTFQVALRELRDLYNIAGHLARAEQRLQVLSQVDGHQQAVWSSLVEEDRRAALAQRQALLQEQQDVLRTKLRAAIEQADGRLLADAQQTARWQRLERAERLAAAIDTDSDTDTNTDTDSARQDTLRLLRGLLIWDDNEQYPERAWRARVQLRELETLAQETGAALARVDAAIASREHSDFSARIGELAERTAIQSQQVAQTVAQSETALREIAIAELERQGEQLRRGLGQSQLAIARIYDQASASNLAGGRHD